MDQLGKVVVQLEVINPAHKGVDPNNLFARRTRRVTLFSQYGVTEQEAAKLIKEFVTDNLPESKYGDLICTWSYTNQFYM